MPKSVTLAEPFLVDQHVLRLDVAVDDVARVRGAERARDLDRVGHRLGDREPSVAPDPLLQRLALDVLEHDVRPAAVVLAGIDHPDDVGMGELRHRPRLAAEALELIGVARHLAVHQLDRDLALERLVERAVDGRHAPGPDPGLKPVAAVEGGAEQRAHVISLFCATSPLRMAITTRIPYPSSSTPPDAPGDPATTGAPRHRRSSLFRRTEPRLVAVQPDSRQRHRPGTIGHRADPAGSRMVGAEQPHGGVRG